MNAIIVSVSNTAHMIAGCSFFIFAAFEVFEAMKRGTKIPALGGFLLFLGGLAGILLMADKAGGTVEGFLNLLSSESIFILFSGFYMLISTTGLVGIMRHISKNMSAFWNFFQIVLICCLAAVIYLYPQFYMNKDAALSAQIHSVACYAIAAGAIISVFNIFIKNKVIALISVFCFFIAGAIVIQFKEEPKSFSVKQYSIGSGDSEISEQTLPENQ